MPRRKVFEVALRKESVDRNKSGNHIGSHIKGSLSARRAWIEIQRDKQPLQQAEVALRKESVDRNTSSSRSAGIIPVALRKESVDRNFGIASPSRVMRGRSPQGERG